MKRRFFASIATVLMLLAAAPATAQTYAIVNARVAAGTGGPEVIENGIVLIVDGRIARVGAGVAVPAGAQTLDAHGGWVTPGIFAGLTNIGESEVFEGVPETNDARASESVVERSVLDGQPW